MRIEGVKSIDIHLVNANNRASKEAEISRENFKKSPESPETVSDASIKKFTENDLKDIAEDLEDFAIEIKNTRFEFSIHEETKRVIVRIYDKESNELISEIPPEKFLDLIANIWKQVGLIIDKKV
ncbi:MAG: flagellar protein FlaG [Tepidanaerobacteraceae bacterium]|nr:flagellar protein FlaG [Tepidanaerobacteraceae bacterium]